MNKDPCQIGTRNLSALFVTALLSKRRDLDLDSLLRMVSELPEFDIVDESALAHYLPRKPCSWASRQQAARKAHAWCSRGVFILSKTELTGKGTIVPECPKILFAWGNRAAAVNPKIAFLCSRQSPSRIPHSPFLETLRTTVLMHVKPGWSVVSSYGTAGYDSVTTMNRGASTIVVCPMYLPFMDHENRLEAFLATYDGFFDLQNTLFVASSPPGLSISRTEAMLRRDKIVAGLAEAIFAVDVRPKGNMEEIIGSARGRGVPVEIVSSFSTGKPGPNILCTQVPESGSDTAVPVAKNAEDFRSHTRVSTERKNPSTPLRGGSDAFPDTRLFGNVYLFHYTRSVAGPWPGESLADYWNSVLGNDPHRGHTGLDTLWRILSEKRIRASARLIRSRDPVVCLSALPPEKLPSLMKWRRGLRRWTVEPYGVGIEAATLKKIGARPVVYGVSQQYEAMPPHEKYLFQAIRSKGYLWADELEWRLRGDLRLDDIPQEKMVVLVARCDDVRLVQSCCTYRVICWESFFGNELDLLTRRYILYPEMPFQKADLRKMKCMVRRMR